MNVSGFVGCMSKRKCWRMDPKRPRPRKKDLVLVKDVADDCVTNGGDACCWVVLLSCPSFFFSYFCRYGSALAVKIFFGNIVRDGIEDRARRWATDGDIKSNGGVGACLVGLRLRWGGWGWVELMNVGSCVGVWW